jgi:hypothetical protein
VWGCPTVGIYECTAARMHSNRNLGRGVWSVGSGVWGLEFGVWGAGFEGCGVRLGMRGLAFRVRCLGVWG